VQYASIMQRAGQAMRYALLNAETPVLLQAPAPRSLDTVRALCHDLRQPLAVIRLLAETRGGDVQHRLDGILEEARWLSDVVEAVIGGAADDSPGTLDVVELVAHCVHRAQPTAGCGIEVSGIDRAMAIASPVALGRAISCVLDNAVRAAGPGGQVIVEVTGADGEITLRVIDDGPGFGQVGTNNSLGLTITRGLIAACGGTFDLSPGRAGGVVARIVLPALSCGAVPS
jgi:signal transduction histidine kinase